MGPKLLLSSSKCRFIRKLCLKGLQGPQQISKAWGENLLDLRLCSAAVCRALAKASQAQLQLYSSHKAWAQLQLYSSHNTKPQIMLEV